MTASVALTALVLTACTAVDDTGNPADTGDTDTGDTDTGDTDTGDTDTGDTDPPDEERQLVTSMEQGGRTVEVWAGAPLRVGLNDVAFRVLDGGSTAVDGLTLTQAPLMDMGESAHACPYTEPVAAGDGWYESEVVFQMAGAWADTVSVSDVDYAFTMLEVAETGLAQMAMVGTATWAVTLTFAADPEMGDNPFVLTVHDKQDMLTFPEVAGLSVTVEPFMPSMGHGSEGSVDPTYTEHGKYEGSVNFSMAGTWEATFTLDDGAGGAATVTFEVEV
jgi:hypothetical protein